METSLTDANFISEVRDALAGMDASKIPDDTILQQRDRFVEPAVNKNGGGGLPQEDFDNCVIAYTAEKAFKSWLSKRRMADADLQVSARPGQLKKNLEGRTNEVFGLYGIDRARTSSRDVYTTTNL